MVIFPGLGVQFYLSSYHLFLSFAFLFFSFKGYGSKDGDGNVTCIDEDGYRQRNTTGIIDKLRVEDQRAFDDDDRQRVFDNDDGNDKTEPPPGDSPLAQLKEHVHAHTTADLNGHDLGAQHSEPRGRHIGHTRRRHAYPAQCAPRLWGH